MSTSTLFFRVFFRSKNRIFVFDNHKLNEMPLTRFPNAQQTKNVKLFLFPFLSRSLTLDSLLSTIKISFNCDYLIFIAHANYFISIFSSSFTLCVVPFFLSYYWSHTCFCSLGLLSLSVDFLFFSAFDIHDYAFISFHFSRSRRDVEMFVLKIKWVWLFFHSFCLLWQREKK